MMKTIKRSAGAALVAERDGEHRILLIRVRRASWELPKGGIELGETARDAAERELREEASVEGPLRVETSLGALRYELNDSEIFKQVEYFVVRCPGTLRLGKRVRGTRERRWVREQDVETLEFVNEELRPIVRAALMQVRGWA